MPFGSFDNMREFQCPGFNGEHAKDCPGTVRTTTRTKIRCEGCKKLADAASIRASQERRQRRMAERFGGRN